MEFRLSGEQTFFRRTVREFAEQTLGERQEIIDQYRDGRRTDAPGPRASQANNQQETYTEGVRP